MTDLRKNALIELPHFLDKGLKPREVEWPRSRGNLHQ